MGGSRIGLALSDQLGIIASPLGFINRTTTTADIEAILDKALRHKASQILIGMPITAKGRTGRQAQLVHEFCEELQGCTAIPLLTWDERYSTLEAEILLRQAGQKPSRDKGLLDAAAAAVILQSYLDSGKAL